MGLNDLVFWLKISIGGTEYLCVLDTRATISIVAKKMLPLRLIRSTMPTAAIRMGDGFVVYSCGDCSPDVPLGTRNLSHAFYVIDTEAFDFVVGTDFFTAHPQVRSMSLQSPYVLHVDHGHGEESLPLEHSGQDSTFLRVLKQIPARVLTTTKMEDYQHRKDILVQGLKNLGFNLEDLSVELFASDKQHVLDLYCSKGVNCCYKWYWPTLGMPYGKPRLSELAKVLKKVAYECSRMVICTPDWGAVGDNQYWRELLEKLTLATFSLPDEAIYIPLGKSKPVGKPGWGSMLSFVDGTLAFVPWEELDPVLLQEVQEECKGYTLETLKERKKTPGDIQILPGGDEYPITKNYQPLMNPMMYLTRMS